MTPETLELVLTYVAAALPSIAAIVSIIIAVIKSVSSTKTIRTSIEHKMDTVVGDQKISQNELRKELKELKIQMDAVMRENISLKQSLNECITVITKIKKG